MPDLQQDLTDSAQPEGEGKHDSLMDVAEPDDAFLLASEQEDSLAAPRRALIVIVTDHPGEQSDSTSQLVSELLAEANFRVDGAIVVRSKKSKIRQAIETAVVGGVDLVLTVGGTGVGPVSYTHLTLPTIYSV